MQLMNSTLILPLTVAQVELTNLLKLVFYVFLNSDSTSRNDLAIVRNCYIILRQYFVAGANNRLVLEVRRAVIQKAGDDGVIIG